MAYTTQVNVETALGRTLEAAEVTYFTGVLLPSIENYINTETGTIFGTTADTEIYVSGDGTDRLVIPTMHSITSVEKDDTVLSTDYWQSYPATAPYLALTHKTGTWEEGIDNYTVTGKLGYASVPGDITAIATELAVNYFSSKRDTTGAAVKSERVGDYSVTYATSSTSEGSLMTIQGYKRLSRSI